MLPTVTAASAGGAEALDLKRHTPAEFAGKTVVVGGRQYVIGARFRENSQGYAHRLVNLRSGVCLHAIQVRSEYLKDPTAALQASLAKAAATLQMVSKMRLATPPVEMSFLTVERAHGGSFEVHEFSTGSGDWPGKGEPVPGNDAIGEGYALAARADYTSALTRLSQVLARYPDQTIALSLMASCQASLGDASKAYELASRVVEVEPNLAFYRAAQTDVAIKMPSRARAPVHFEELRARYPDLRYFDDLGVRAYLGVGDAEKARELMGAAMLTPTEAATLAPVVETAIRANERIAELENRLSFPVPGAPPSSQVPASEEEVMQILEETHASYPANPFIQANLGARLWERGDPKRAVGLLLSAAGGVPGQLAPYCWANAAYCLIKASDWRRSFYLLEQTMTILPRDSTGYVAPADVPGILAWMYRSGRVLEKLEPSASEVLDNAIAACPDKSLISPEVREMAELLRRAERSMRGNRP
jgi:tetratricopeptide (TPR) repeat protein